MRRIMLQYGKLIHLQDTIMEFLKFTKSRTVNLLISLAVFLVFAFLLKFTILLENMENGATNLRFIIRAPEEKQELESGLYRAPGQSASAQRHHYCRY